MDSPVSGSVWQCKVTAGDQVQAGDVLMILESMKMEIEIHATQSGTVHSLLKQQGQSVSAGQPLVIIEENATELA
jgi:urea carboxylase